MSGVIVPRVGDFIHSLGRWAGGTAPPRAKVACLEHFPTPAWSEGYSEPGVTAVCRTLWPGDQFKDHLREDFRAHGWKTLLDE
jgi:hypothetical protein